MIDNTITNQKKISTEELDIFQSLDIILKDKLWVLLFVIIGTSIGFYIANNESFFEKTEEHYVSAKLYPMKQVDSFKLVQLNRTFQNLNNYALIQLNTFSMSGQPGSTSKPMMDAVIGLYGSNSFGFTVNGLFDSVYYFLNSFKVHNQFISDFSKFESASLNVRVIEKEQLKYIEIQVNFKNMIASEETIELATRYINKYINDAFLLTRKEILDTINLSIANYQFAKISTIEKLKKQNLDILDGYESVVEDRLFHLKEQVEIAKESNIDIPQEGFDFSSIINTMEDGSRAINSNLEYNRGYIALNKEIELLQKRKNIKFITPQYRRNDTAIKYLEKNDITEEIIKELNFSGFASGKKAIESFNLVRYNPNEFVIVGTEKQDITVNKSVIILFGSGLGLVIAIMLSLFRFHYKNRKKINY